MIVRRDDRLRRNRVAFTLTEMLVVMVAFGMCLTVGSALLITTVQAGRHAELTANRVSRQVALARELRDDVHRAEAAPDKWNGLAAGPTQLILRMPDSAIVVYRWENSILERIETIEKKESRRILPVDAKEFGLEFTRPQPGVVTLNLIPTTEKKSSQRREVSAAVGGARR